MRAKVEVPRLRPTVAGVVTVTDGNEKYGVLVKLKASARNSKSIRSRIRTRLLSEASRLNDQGKRKALRPMLPYSPAAGSENFARSSAEKINGTPVTGSSSNCTWNLLPE